MRNRSAKHLQDVLDAASFIIAAVSNCDLAGYKSDRLLRQAVERNFEIIGEAANRLAKDAPDLAARIDHLAQILAFRNLLIHGYDLVEDERVWQTIQNDLVPLRRKILSLLQEP